MQRHRERHDARPVLGRRRRGSRDHLEALDVGDVAGALVAPAGRTRTPVLMPSRGPSTTCTMAVSAPSSWMSANANGRSSGWLGLGVSTHVHEVTTPSGPTSTSSGSTDAPVAGSYSSGGERVRSPAREASNRPASRPSRYAPITGPDAARVRELQIDLHERSGHHVS